MPVRSPRRNPPTATAGDISWESPPGIFNLRVAAILTSGSDILLCTIEGLAGGMDDRRGLSYQTSWLPVRSASCSSW
jgi:hypothetical protein